MVELHFQMENEGDGSTTSTVSLIPLLQKALLQQHQQVKIDPLPPEAPQVQLDLEYISKMLLDADTDEEGNEVSALHHSRYQAYMDDFNSIITSSTCVQSSEVDHGQVEQEVFALLSDCATAVAANKSAQVYSLIRQIKIRNPLLEKGYIKNVAVFFSNALIARLEHCGLGLCSALFKEASQKRFMALRLMCMNLPWFSVIDLVSNAMIFEACKGASRIHIIDYGTVYGCQWPWLIRALSQRPEGAPQLKITGIDSPQNIRGGAQVEKHLRDYAKSCGITFEFVCTTAKSWELAQPQCNDLNKFVVVSINKKCLFRSMNAYDSTTSKELFERMKNLQPAMLILSFLNADSNVSSPFFIQRFNAAVRYFANFLSFSEEALVDHPQELGFVQKLVEGSIMNVVACEGADRTERPGPYYLWDSMAKRSGFEQLPLSDQVIDTAKSVWRGRNYNLYRDDNWLLFGWKEDLIFGICAWKPKKRYSF